MRYRMLETLREFAAERQPPEEREEARRRHALHFAGEVERYAAAPFAEQRDQLEADYENLRAALHWSAETAGEGELALRLAAGMYELWLRRNHLAEARQWLERVIAAAPEPSALLAKALNAAGNIGFYQHDYEAAVAFHRRGLEVCRRIGDARGMAVAQGNLGMVEGARGNYAAAYEAQRACLQTFRSLGLAAFIPGTLNNLAEALQGLGEVERAADLYRKSLEEYRRQGHLRGVAMCYKNLALLALRRDDVAAAADLFAESLATSRQAQDRTNMCITISELAPVLDLLGKTEEARSLRAERMLLLQESEFPAA